MKKPYLSLAILLLPTLAHAEVLPESIDAATARRITLRDAVRIAVENSLSIVLRKESFAATKESVPIAKGRFEPALKGMYLHTNTDEPPQTAQEGAAGQILHSSSDGWNLGVTQQVPTGTTFELDYGNLRSSSSLGTAIAPIANRSIATLTLTQPLLKGFAFDMKVPYADVLRAELGTEQARQDVLAQCIATVRDTELAYWDVVLSLESYRVQKASRELAKEQLGLTQRQIDAGTLPPSDLITAEATLAQRELGLVQAESDIETAADVLRRVLNLPRSSWMQALLPQDAPRFDEAPTTFDAALAHALKNRPELKQRNIDVDRAKLDVTVAKADRLPQVDAVLSYGLVGQRTSYSGALGQLTAADAPAWTAGVNFSWTPFNVAARAQLRSREASESLAHTSLDQQLLDLNIELRLALRNVATAVRAVRAAEKLRVLTERTLDAEQRKFMTGQSSNFFIQQRQNDLLQAQLSELQALITHQKATTGLRAAEGLLLEDEHIQLDVAKPKR